MKRIHLLRYVGPPEALAPLFQAARAEGLRVGLLDLPAEAPTPAPAAVAAASSAGAFRAVAVGGGHSVAVKRREGAPVLRDLLREHFLGCVLVVVRGGEEGSRLAGELVEAPVLEVVDGGYRVQPPGEAARPFDPPALAARLRRPRPW